VNNLQNFLGVGRRGDKDDTVVEGSFVVVAMASSEVERGIRVEAERGRKQRG